MAGFSPCRSHGPQPLWRRRGFIRARGDEHGGRVSVEFTIRMIRDGGGTVVGMVAILRDVTKRLEELTL